MGLSLVASPLAVAQLAPAPTALNTSTSSNSPPLRAEQAFRFSERQTTTAFIVTAQIAKGHYLYRASLKLTDAAGNRLPLELPPATPLVDEYFGETQVYFDTVSLQLSLKQLAAISNPELSVHYQGCAKDRYCYPPLSQKLLLTPATP